MLEELPRYYAERLTFRTWEEVTRHIELSKCPPRWWADENQRTSARRKFLSLVAQAAGKPASNDGDRPEQLGRVIEDDNER